MGAGRELNLHLVRCTTTLEAVHFEDYVMSYCPAEQTDGKALKDRRLSRLLR